MKYLATLVLLFALATPAHAQQNQNTLLPAWAFGDGVVVSTSTSPTAKLGAMVLDLAGPLLNGILPVSRGGTGAGSLTGNQFLYTNAAGTVVLTAASSSLALPNAALQNSTISGIALGANLGDLTAGNSSLTFSGTYNGSVARNIILNMGNANIWSALQTFGYASSTGWSSSYASSTLGYFGRLFSLGKSDGCATWASGELNSTGVACGSGGGGSGLSTTTPLADSNVLTYSTAGAGRAYGTATTSATINNGLTGLLTTLNAGGTQTIGLATIAANSVLANITGGAAVPSAVATSSLFAGTNGQVLARVNGTWTGVATTTAGTGLTYTGSAFNVDLGTSIAPAELVGAPGANLFIYTNAAGTGFAGVASSSLSLPNAALQNSTISGVALGGTLNALTATNGTLTFSGSYDGSVARTVGLNLANANTWSALQTFGYASSTGWSSSYASSTLGYFGRLFSLGKSDGCATWSSGELNSTGSACGGSGSTPGGSDGQLQYNNGGAFGGAASTFWDDITSKIGFGSSTPWGQLSINPDGITGPAFVIGSSTRTHFMVNNAGVSVFGTANPLLVTGSELVQFEDEDGAKSDWSFRVGEGGYGTINFGKNNGPLSAPTIVADDDSLGSVIGRGYDGTSQYDSASEIRFFVNGVPGSSGDTSDMPGGILFLTSPDGSATPSERLRITQGGSLGIGTSTPWGRLAVGFSSMTAADYTAPLFSIATSSFSIFSVSATTTNTFGGIFENIDIGIRTVIGRYQATFETLFVNGPFASSYSTSQCDNFMLGQVISADIAIGCGSLQFAEFSTATLDSSGGGNEGVALITVGSGTASDMGGIFAGTVADGGFANIGSTSPITLDVTIGGGSGYSSTTARTIGFGNIGPDNGGAPSSGCYFQATSTPNWQALCSASGVAAVQVDTGVATTTSTSIGARFRVTMGPTGADFYVKTSQNAALTKVARITSGLPSSGFAWAAIWVSRASGGTALAPTLRVGSVRYFARMPWYQNNL